METVFLAYVRQQRWRGPGGGVHDRLPEGRRAPLRGRFRPQRNPGNGATARDAAGAGPQPSRSLRRRSEKAVTAVTAVRAAAAASSPSPPRLPQEGRRTAAAPTGVVDVQLIPRDALVAPSKMIISSRMATARCPCRARGTGP